MIFTIQQASAKVLALINSRPESPRQEEIEAIIARAAVPLSVSLSNTQAELLAAIHEYVAAERALSEAGRANLDTKQPQQYDAIHARHEVAIGHLGKLADQLPTRAQSITDAILRAAVEYCWADKTDGILDNLSDDADDAEYTAARLIDDLVQFAGIRN